MMPAKVSRREFLRLAALTGTGAALAACAPAAAPAPAPAEPAAPAAEAPAAEAPAAEAPAAAPVELEFVMNTSPGWDEAVNTVMDMFMEMYPDISIKFTPIDWDQLTVVLPPRFAAKDPPDLLLTDCFWPWVQQGLVVDLQPLIDRDGVDLSLISDLGAGVILGDPVRYGLPFDFTGSVIGYNKTVLDKYGCVSQGVGRPMISTGSHHADT
jgi:ABC-type glycerol-3-phosphate transport system substrate-binding protein